MALSVIFICSPYRGEVETNIENARRYCRLAFTRGGIPFAPHLLYTQFLDDSQAIERDAGIAMGVTMMDRCDEVWVFGKPTIGMKLEICAAEKMGKPVRYFDEKGAEV